MLSLAIEALRAAAPETIGGPLRFLSVIEEECTGNGALAACLSGQRADAVVLTEPTGLDLLSAGVGILWLEIDDHGKGGARAVGQPRGQPDRRRDPGDRSAPRDGAGDERTRWTTRPSKGTDHPYNVNIGAIRAGDWASSVPALARLEVRIGHPTAWTAGEARGAGSAVDRTPPGDDRGSGNTRRHPADGVPRPGVRADRGPSARASRSPTRTRRRTANPARHAVGVGKHDRRAVLPERFDTPAICYGPTAQNIHGMDESVELSGASSTGARTLARFIADWYANPSDAGSTRDRALMPDAQTAPTILEPVRMRSAGEHIADRIVTAIALGEFVPGQRLPTERDLASI